MRKSMIKERFEGMSCIQRTRSTDVYAHQLIRSQRSIQLTQDLHEAWNRPIVPVRLSMLNGQKQSAYSTTLLITFCVYFASVVALPLQGV